jgi:DNA-binding response OmpR family regulator
VPREHILIVEDDAVIGAELLKALAASGYGASLVKDGRAALADVHDQAPDLILLDLGLPDIEGVELCRRVHTGETEVLLRPKEFDLLAALVTRVRHA